MALKVDPPSMIAHQPQQTVGRSKIGQQRRDKHIGVDHYLVHGPLPAHRRKALRKQNGSHHR
jgi:hypothetical protein